MSLERVQETLITQGYGHYLDALPSSDSMTWTQFGAEPALVIGKKDEKDVLAYLTEYRKKGLEPRYTVATNAALGEGELLWSRDAVLKWPLFEPFNTITKGPKARMKVKLTMLVRFYFLWKGHLPQLNGDLDRVCKNLGHVMKSVYREGEGDGLEDDEADMIEESPEPDDAASAFGMSSASRDRTKSVSNGVMIEQPTLTNTTPIRQSQETNPDLDHLRQYLIDRNALYLLDNIPDPEEVQFTDQTYLVDAQPKKLFIGSHKESGDDIYAYMVRAGQRCEIRFYVEGLDFNTPIRSDDAGCQRLLHPFSKTFPKPTSPNVVADQARLALMIKYYFIAAGIAPDNVLKESKTFGDRLRSSLEYIAKRMGPAAVKPPPQAMIGKSPKRLENEDNRNNNGPGEGANKHSESEESDYVFQSSIKPTMASKKPPRVSTTPKNPEATSSEPKKTVFARKSAPTIPRRPTPADSIPTPPLPRPTPPIADSTVTPSATPTPAPSLPHPPISSSKPTKRPRSSTTLPFDDDAIFEDLRRLMTQNDDLTREINAVAHELETHEMRKEAFLAKWKAEHEALVQKQDKMMREKIEVRRQVFKRQRKGEEELGEI
ncbi:GREB1 domain containing protein [Pyrenophora teres f. maculata]|nr:GREB1 domain containing protein [Pyrenophora teres f. maculata]